MNSTKRLEDFGLLTSIGLRRRSRNVWAMPSHGLHHDGEDLDWPEDSVHVLFRATWLSFLAAVWHTCLDRVSTRGRACLIEEYSMCGSIAEMADESGEHNDDFTSIGSELAADIISGLDI